MKKTLLFLLLSLFFIPGLVLAAYPYKTTHTLNQDPLFYWPIYLFWVILLVGIFLKRKKVMWVSIIIAILILSVGIFYNVYPITTKHISAGIPWPTTDEERHDEIEDYCKTRFPEENLENCIQKNMKLMYPEQ